MIPLMYEKIYKRLREKSKKLVITPRDFRLIIAEFGLCREDWFHIAVELKGYGYFDEVNKNRIVVSDKE